MLAVFAVRAIVAIVAFVTVDAVYAVRAIGAAYAVVAVYVSVLVWSFHDFSPSFVAPDCSGCYSLVVLHAQPQNFLKLSNARIGRTLPSISWLVGINNVFAV